MKKKSLSYIEPVALPGNNAHSIQIEKNLYFLDKIYDLKVFSYKTNIRKFNFKHFPFKKVFKKRFIPYNTFTFLYKLRKFNFQEDIILTRSPLIAFYFKKKSKEVILELHDIPNVKDGFFHYFLFKFPLEKIPLFFLRKSKKVSIVTISQGLKKDLIKLGISSSNILVAPDGVNLSDFDISKSKSQLRKNLSLPSNKKLVLYMGSFQNWKGYDTLLNASKFFDSSIQLVMVGGSSSQISHLKKLYPETIFRSFVNNVEVPNYLHASDLLVLPNSGKYKISSHYTSPLKLFEYMACKKPIIASNLPSIKEIVSSKEVIFFKADSSEDLFKKITKVLKDKDLIKLLSKNSFEKVKKYTWERRADNMHNFIKNVKNNK